MGLFNTKNKTSKVVVPPDVIGLLLDEAKKEDVTQSVEFSFAISLFKIAMGVLASKINATFSIVVKEGKVIMLKIDNWQIYWLADDHDHITLESKGKFEKISADQETLVYTLHHLDEL